MPGHGMARYLSRTKKTTYTSLPIEHGYQTPSDNMTDEQ